MQQETNGYGQIQSSLSLAEIPPPDELTPISESKKRVEVFVPATLNDGTIVPEAELEKIQDLVLRRFGGCTLHPNLKGEWLNGEAYRCRDEILKIEVVFDDDPEAVNTIIAIAEFIREHLDQEAIFVTVEAVDVLTVRECAPSRPIGKA